MSEQLGTGNPAVTNTIPGDLEVGGDVLVGGGVAFNGVTSVPSKPTINTFSVATTTSANAGINAILLALKNLGLINSDAA